MRRMGLIISFILVAIGILVFADTVKPTTAKSLNWLYKDEEIPSKAKFPMSVSDYGIDANNADVSYPNVAGYFQGRIKILGYSWKMLPPNYDLNGYNMKLISRKPPEKIFSVYILEREKHGWAHWVHAEFVGVGQAPNLSTAIGYAENQVITLSEYHGFDTYRVYPVEGIRVPQ